MRIGFDAKRAFFNFTGLGNYSRFIIRILCQYFPQNQYIFYTPKPTGDKDILPEVALRNATTRLPYSIISYLQLHSLWRSWWMGNTFEKDRLDIYHGLSNEIPQRTTNKVPSVITMHDLIFLRHPELYKGIDRRLYTYKYQKSCERATGIIAISEQTKWDLMEYFKVPDEKIRVIYQGCNLIFRKNYLEDQIHLIKEKYHLPDTFMLNVGTIEPRKNALSILKGMHIANIDVPLVVVGRATAYKQKLEQYIRQHDLQKKVIFLHDVTFEDLPLIYRLASLFIYPSIFEGFGIPILEALVSGVPVITSTGSCFAEAGGMNSAYVTPGDDEALGHKMEEILTNEKLRKEMITKGLKHAEQFEDSKLAHNLISYYEEISGVKV
jgi:glycosyltransferase involved in cell wall biosynthesis